MNRSKESQPAAAICSARYSCMRARCRACRSFSTISRCGAIGVSLPGMKPSIENSPLRDQVVLITGGARRVGAEIARTLHAAGANILIHYRSSAAAAIALADEFNRMRAHSAAIFAASLSNAQDADELIAATLLEFGRLDILVNNASSF